MKLENRISRSNDAGLVGLLLDKLIENFKEATRAIEDGNYELVADKNNHSRAIMTELLVQFSGEDETSESIREINNYANRLMTEGQYKKDIEAFEKCIKIIEPIQEAFKELEVSESPKSVTGLTYGKSNLDDYSLKGSKSFEV